MESDVEVYISDICVFKFNQADAQDMIEVLGDEVFVRQDDVLTNISSVANYFLRKRMVEKYNTAPVIS